MRSFESSMLQIWKCDFKGQFILRNHSNIDSLQYIFISGWCSKVFCIFISSNQLLNHILNTKEENYNLRTEMRLTWGIGSWYIQLKIIAFWTNSEENTDKKSVPIFTSCLPMCLQILLVDVRPCPKVCANN